tara:strand:+ start:761 stop:1033 length:273 start_codon:yes stop_codon:yes gene_type:complete
MKELKLKLITYLCKTFKGKVKKAKTGNGINVFADISLERAKIEQMASACDLSVVVTPKRTNQFTGEEQAARTWIGAVDDNTSEEDLLAQI